MGKTVAVIALGEEEDAWWDGKSMGKLRSGGCDALADAILLKRN